LEPLVLTQPQVVSNDIIEVDTATIFSTVLDISSDGELPPLSGHQMPRHARDVMRNNSLIQNIVGASERITHASRSSLSPQEFGNRHVNEFESLYNNIGEGTSQSIVELPQIQIVSNPNLTQLVQRLDTMQRNAPAIAQMITNLGQQRSQPTTAETRLIKDKCVDEKKDGDSLSFLEKMNEFKEQSRYWWIGGKNRSNSWTKQRAKSSLRSTTGGDRWCGCRVNWSNYHCYRKYGD
jgi:hypothetical protein